MKWVKSWNFLGYKDTIRLEGKNVGSLGKKCYYKKDIKYLFRAHPNFFGQKKRILKRQVLWSNLQFKFANFGNFFDFQ